MGEGMTTAASGRKDVRAECADVTVTGASVEVMWRCRECGKWSHAKKRPLRHKRFGGEEYDLAPEQVERVAEWTTTREHDTGAYIDAAWLWCGPFDRYVARHSDTATPPALDPSNLPKPKTTDDRPDLALADLSEVPF